MKNKYSVEVMQNYLWEALQDFKNGNMTVKELKAINDTAGRLVQTSMLNILSKNIPMRKKMEIGK
jgi:hypothetical protein